MKNKKSKILASVIKPKRENKKGDLKLVKKPVKNLSKVVPYSANQQVDSLKKVYLEKINVLSAEILSASKTLDSFNPYLSQGIIPPENVLEKSAAREIKRKNNPFYFNLPSRIFRLIALLLIVGMNLPGLSAVGVTVANFTDVEKTTGNLIDSAILDFSLSSSGWQPSSPLLPGASTTENITVVDEDDSVDFKYIASVVETGGDHNFCEKLDLEASLEGAPVYSGDLLSFISSQINFGSSTDEWVFKTKLPAGESDVDGKKCEFDFLYQSWQEEFPVFPDGFHDEEKVSNVIEGGETKAPNVCPWDSGPGRVVINFNNNRYLRSDMGQSNASDGPVIEYVPAGTYDITLASYDDHLSKPDQIQPQEQWKLIMKNAGGSQVAVTSSIRDIVDATEEQVVEKVGDDFSVSEDIYQFTAFHSAYPNPNPNSLRALCAMFEGENLPAAQELIPPPSGRADIGLLTLYTFEENSGQVVWDVSGTGTPLNLWIPDLSKVSRISGGLSINSSTLVSSLSPALKLTNGLKATNEITIEAWVKPANTTQDGPARIATLSQDTLLRNFTLAQDATKYTGRLRTTTVGTNGIPPAVFTPSGAASTTLQHIVYTRTASTAKIYVDGTEVASETITGNFSNWDSSFQFGLANEFTMNRTWLGELHLVAIYDRDLSAAEVAQNFSAGPDNQIVINEFLPNPTGSDDAPMPGGEWVELYNLSATAINVAGWTLYDNSDSNPVVITSSNSDNNGNTADSGETIVPARGYLVVYLNGAYSEWLNNSGGDSVRLYSGTVGSSPLRDSYSYAGDAPENKSYARIPDGIGSFVDPIPTPLAPNKIADATETSPEEIDEADSKSSSSENNNLSAVTHDSSQTSSDVIFSSSSISDAYDTWSSSSSSAVSSGANENDFNFSSSSSSSSFLIEEKDSLSASSSTSATVASSTLNQSSSSQAGSDASGQAISSASSSSSESSFASPSLESSTSSSSSEQSSASSTPIVKEDEIPAASAESSSSSQSSQSEQNTDEAIVDNKAIVRENSDTSPQIVSGEPPITD